MRYLEPATRSQESGIKRITHLSWLLVLGYCILVSFASFKPINTYQTKANQIAVDNFGNFYTAADNRVLKFSPEGKYLYPYEEFRNGKIGMIDVTNPMKIMVFYPDFMKIVMLDRFLSPLTTYNFFDMGYQNITAVASSVDGRIWFYDNVTFKLKKIDETGKVYRESQPLNVLIEQAPNPNFIVERDNEVFVNDPTIGILVFDVFGSYAKTIPIKGLKRFQILQSQVIYEDSMNLKSYNTLTLETKTLALPDTSEVLQVALEKEVLGVLKKDKVDFYRY